MLEKLKLMQENKFSLPSDSFPTDGPKKEKNSPDLNATGTEDLSSEEEWGDPFGIDKKVIQSIMTSSDATSHKKNTLMKINGIMNKSSKKKVKFEEDVNESPSKKYD